MKEYGLIGRPLKHSFSKAYFTQKFAAAGITDCRYENFELEDIFQLSFLLRQHPELKGLNVTIPYKKEVIPFLQVQNEVVREIGACNCIKISEGKLYGYNTDVVGFRQSLLPFLQPHHKKALVLGTGGSSQAVQYALKQLGISFQLVSRKKEAHTITYPELTKWILKDHLLIVNTTPVGMYPHVEQAPELPYDLLTPEHLLYDLIYNPEETLFLKKGAERGATVSNGYQMLLLQAEESWRIWNEEEV